MVRADADERRMISLPMISALDRPHELLERIP